MLMTLIEKEVKSLFNANIIISLKFSRWVENLVPFGLMKAEEIFHREMDIAFVEEKDRFVVVYMNYIIVVFYKSDVAHLKHLEKIFLNCRKIGQ